MATDISQHFAGLAKAKESGLFKMGGAILEDMPADDEVSSLKFAGSTLIVVAESRQAVIDALKGDIYVSSGVWDFEKVSLALRIESSVCVHDNTDGECAAGDDLASQDCFPLSLSARSSDETRAETIAERGPRE